MFWQTTTIQTSGGETTPRLNSCSDIYLNFTSIFSSLFSNSHRSLVLLRHERSQHPNPFWNTTFHSIVRIWSARFLSDSAREKPLREICRDRFARRLRFVRLFTTLDTQRVNSEVSSSRQIFQSAGIVRSVNASESLRRVKGDGKRDWEIETASIIL
jgi:hypothetical protein